MAQTDEFGKHEVIHVSSIVMEMFDDYLLSHGAVEAHPELKAAAQTTFDALYQFYRLAAETFDDPAQNLPPKPNAPIL